jgi:hypothetical protein
MEKKCLWLEFEAIKSNVEALKNEKKRCKDEMDVRAAAPGYIEIHRVDLIRNGSGNGIVARERTTSDAAPGVVGKRKHQTQRTQGSVRETR